jgi:hypothetical protein
MFYKAVGPSERGAQVKWLVTIRRQATFKRSPLFDPTVKRMGEEKETRLNKLTGF